QQRAHIGSGDRRAIRQVERLALNLRRLAQPREVAYPHLHKYASLSSGSMSVHGYSIRIAKNRMDGGRYESAGKARPPRRQQSAPPHELWRGARSVSGLARVAVGDALAV